MSTSHALRARKVICDANAIAFGSAFGQRVSRIRREIIENHAKVFAEILNVDLQICSNLLPMELVFVLLLDGPEIGLASF